MFSLILKCWEHDVSYTLNFNVRDTPTKIQLSYINSQFQTLSDDCELLYLHSCSYTPSAEAGLNPKDAILSIDWPLMISELSKRDTQHPMLNIRIKGMPL